VEINAIVEAIKARVELNRPNVKAQAILMNVDTELNLMIGCVVDPSLITTSMLEDVSRFNEEANPDVYIQFIEGKIVNNGADNALFMLMFNASKCNGGL